MAEGDNRAVYTGTATGDISEEQAGGTVKGNPIDMPRLPEDDARSTFYASANNKDVLPEHTARRTTYPHITAIS